MATLVTALTLMVGIEIILTKKLILSTTPKAMLVMASILMAGIETT